jgi:hypothetical protein
MVELRVKLSNREHEQLLASARTREMNKSEWTRYWISRDYEYLKLSAHPNAVREKGAIAVTQLFNLEPPLQIEDVHSVVFAERSIRVKLSHGQTVDFTLQEWGNFNV